jgi:anti-sigma regulatory factor (Ser/Thr protein kinase)
MTAADTKIYTEGSGLTVMGDIGRSGAVGAWTDNGATARRSGVCVAEGNRGTLTPFPPLQHRGIAMDSEWPLLDVLELGALPGAVPCARLHARQLLWEWGLAAQSKSAELLVSELVTNAIAASRSMEQMFPVRLWLLADKARVLILVWDASPWPPAPLNDIGEDAESGRGLLLVESISERWDWYFPEETGGKVVWALLGKS